MKLHIYEGKAFAHMGDGKLLCIGTKKQVMFRPDTELAKMYLQALAHGEYNEINTSPNVVN